MDFLQPENYINRELSWLEFNKRVLGEARNKKLPLFERLKFLSITASNLDEFVMVRVASLKDMVHADYDKKDIAGMTPAQQLDLISVKHHEFVELQYQTLNRALIPGLAKNNINVITDHRKLNKKQAEFVDSYFMKEVYPVVTPMAVDSSRPFPLIRNKSLNIAALLQKRDGAKEYEFATVQVPSVLDRIVVIPSKTDTTVILLEEIIERNIQKLFLNYDVLISHPYRIMRNADIDIDEEETDDLLAEMQRQLKRRQWGQAIKLEVEEDIDKKLLKILKKNLKMDDSDIFYIHGPLDLTFLMKMYGMKGFDELKREAYKPMASVNLTSEESIFKQIRRGDILLHHPYEAFDPVVGFVSQAAKDPKVLAIKQTLYRVSGNSPIISSLAAAAEAGKQVSVLVELKARFDEENNINWAKKLEKAGCHVIYGLVGLKTHCKITLVVRKEDDGIRRYVHLGTGNYNDSTAKLYTDIGLLTCDNAMGEDATAVFNMISGYSEPEKWNELTLAPLWLREKFIELINQEIENSNAGKPARIYAKMNSLCDKQIIAELYRASCAGVKIDLIVRGICCLRPGIKDLSENITVRSIVGNFLEHARIFVFYNDGDERVFLASADWMPRNLDRRVEIMFPVHDPHLKERVMHIMDVQLADNVKSKVMQPDGSYVKLKSNSKKITHVNAQETFCREAKSRWENKKETKREEKLHVFVPQRSVNASKDF